MRAPRRLLLRAAVLVPVATALAGCGFQLRRAPEFAFSQLLVQGAERSALGLELRRSIASAGVEVVTDVRRMATVQAVLDVVQELREKVVVGRNAAGEVREYQLRLRVNFKLRTPDGKDLIGLTEIAVQSYISFSETAVLAKETEEAALYRDMQSDMVQQIMRRLAAVRTL